jgi:LPS sulfotransferase NodH
MPKRFILLATQRTGSSWLQEMLNTHPDMKVYSELFLADARGVPIWEPNDFEFAETFVEGRTRRPVALTRGYWTVRYLRRLFDQPDVEANGFKYMYDQVKHSPMVLGYAAATRVPIVHLIRRNLLDTWISTKRAEATGMYHRPTDGRKPIPWAPSHVEDVAITLDPGETLLGLRRMVHERQQMRRWLVTTRTPTHEVVYEDLVKNPRQVADILAFIGVGEPSGLKLESPLEKVSLASRSDTVRNLSELKVSFSGTQFEEYFHSDS